MAEVTSRLLPAGRVQPWHLLEAGAGPPLLLVHGWPEYSAIWARLVPVLAGRHRLLMPDLPGFGASADPNHGRPAENMGLAELAADLLALIEALGLERVGVVTHDIGGFVVQELARLAPHRLSGIFLFDCATPGIGPRWRDADRVNEIWYQSFHQQPFAAQLVGASREACRAYFGHFLRHWAHRPEAFSDADVERWVDCHMQPGRVQAGFNWYRSVNAARLRVMRGEAPPPTPIQLPARCLWPLHDALMRPDWAEGLAEVFPGIQVDFCEAGHFPHWEIPEVAGAAIAAFFSQVASA